MQLGKTLVGAIIGAAIGVGLLIAAFMMFGWDGFWLAIPFAIVTGLGVRMMVATTGHASYARGALTGVLALSAYLGGIWVVAKLAEARTAKTADRSAQIAKSDEPAGEPGDAKENATEPVAPAPQANAAPIARPADDMHRPMMPRQYAALDIISLAVAALVAYELGRGTGGVPGGTTGVVPPEPAPAGTHPDS